MTETEKNWKKLSNLICLHIFISKSDKSYALLADHQADGRGPLVICCSRPNQVCVGLEESLSIYTASRNHIQ